LNFSRLRLKARRTSRGRSRRVRFSERGVYRPGDEIHIGLVVKQHNWGGNLKGLPIETEVVDARDLRVQTKNSLCRKRDSRN